MKGLGVRMSCNKPIPFDRCPVCGRWRSIRVGGALRKHMGWTDEGEWAATCAGSGRKP